MVTLRKQTSLTPVQKDSRSILSPETKKSVSKKKLVSRASLNKKIKNLEFEKSLIFDELKLTREFSKKLDEHMR